MSDLIVVKTFSSINDATMVKNLLDQEDIPSFITGENTNQVLNYLPVVNISLMVEPNNYDSAIAVIREGGYETEEGPDNLTQIITLTNKIPYLNNLSPIKRIIILIVTISILILLCLFLLVKIRVE